MSGLDEHLLEKLVCPVTRTSLRHDVAAGELISDAAGLAYPVRNGIAVMLIDEARRIGAGEVQDGD